LPIGSESEFRGVIDLISMKSITYKDLDMIIDEIPEEYRRQAAKYREMMIEKLADFDESLMEKYIAEEEITESDIKRAARHAVLTLCVTPVFCGTAFKNKGVRLLLDAVVDYLPSPIDRGIITGADVNNPKIVLSRKPSYKRPFSALAFKITNDAYVGQQTFIRVYSGELMAGSYVLNATKGKKERIGRILRIHADERKEVKVLRAR